MMSTTRRFFLTGLAAGAGSILLSGCQTPRFGVEQFGLEKESADWKKIGRELTIEIV